MDTAADFVQTVRAFQAQRLPAYVAYTERAAARGIVRENDTPVRVTVDTRTGRIVERSPKDANRIVDTGSEDGDSVVRYLFDPSCYAPVSERTARWNDRPALAISLKALPARACAQEPLSLSTLYADPATFEPLGADGTQSDEGVTVDFAVAYGRFNGYLMPVTVSAHVKGRGLLFWVRERGEARFSDYAFLAVRRQAGSGK